MYAVVRTGGKQYKVETGSIIQIEKLSGDLGSKVQLQDVLMVAQPSESDSQVWLGKPNVPGAIVEAEIVAQGRGEKIVTVKKKRRKNYRRTIGHRQDLTQILVTSIKNGAGKEVILSSDDKAQLLKGFFSNLKPRTAEENN